MDLQAGLGLWSAHAVAINMSLRLGTNSSLRFSVCITEWSQPLAT